MLIQDDKKEEIRLSSDIVDIVSDYVRLKKRGSNFVGLCPFHAEKTPSFNVNPRMQIFKCFGCGVGGDVYQFLMRVERLTFPEAVRSLAERANITIPERNTPAPGADITEALYHALRFAARHFHRELTETDNGLPVLAYLENERGISQASIKSFGLGYAPESWDLLLNVAVNAGISASILEQTGLVIARSNESGFYDRYRNRVIFPILTKVGKVVGFGGRVLDPADQPKYINSPETRVYHKSRELYGLYHAKQEIRRQGEAILVEGYTDVISLSQAGIGHVVATSGTAITREQIKSLQQYCDRVVLLYDADAAGAGAAVRGIDLVLESGMAVYIVQLPKKEDPDSFVRSRGGTEFLKYLHEERIDFVSFKYQSEFDGGSLNTPEAEAAAQRSVIASIGRIGDPLVREQYVRRASTVMGIPDATIHRVLQGLKRGRRHHRPETEALSTASPSAAGLERTEGDVDDKEPSPEEKTLLRLMLEFGAPIVEFILSNMSLDEFTEGPSRRAAEYLLKMYQSGEFDHRQLVDGTLGESVQQLAAEVLTDRFEPSANWEKRQNIEVPSLHHDPKESAVSAMSLLKADRIDEAILVLQRRLADAGGDEAEERSLQARMMDLYAAKKEVRERKYLSWNAV